MGIAESTLEGSHNASLDGLDAPRCSRQCHTHLAQNHKQTLSITSTYSTQYIYPQNSVNAQERDSCET